ncbi:thioredoxin family protein [Actinidia rufa]|uniref:Thioredoxin family protein n=1 Tax=Actinidia rufa TaxID=165716 RepID=A0A7J0EZJ7_9ERIC|nr:thioredoxin family protein [Actinidia rufa]
MGGSVREVQSKGDLDRVLKEGSPVILHFWASWCDASKQMDQVFSHLSTDFPHAHFLRVGGKESAYLLSFGQKSVPDPLGQVIRFRGYLCYMNSDTIVRLKLKNNLRFLRLIRFLQYLILFSLRMAKPLILWRVQTLLVWPTKLQKVAGSIAPGDPAAPASLGMAAGPTVLETVGEFAKENGSSKVESQLPPGLSDGLEKRLQQLIDSQAVMLFMKGSPKEPKCGFSRKVVDILNEEKVKFGSFDILTNDEVREGLKKFSNWPTFPQLYCKGELLGGSDIAIAMHESGELKEVFRDHGIDIGDSNEAKVAEPNGGQGGIAESTGLSATLTSRLASLISSSAVMLFMKGKPDEPKCGFSRKVVDILQEEKVEFGSFDILTDDEVRQGLKVYSKLVQLSPTSGELENVLAVKGITRKETLEDRLKKLITSSPVMLFMKGTPDAPRCGFSSKVVNALRNEDVSFGSFDILSDDEVRQGLKTFSNWPTFPQIYYKGELIGGCDIVMELRDNGELKSTLSE